MALLKSKWREQYENSKKKPTYPKDHQAGMEVPVGGSNCAKCEYLSDDKKHCGEPNFIAWDGSSANLPKPAGSNVIPAPIDRYCSDWFDWKKPKKEKE